VGLGERQSEVERAIADLRRAASESAAWKDEQRERFDRERIDPLLAAATQLAHALEVANQDFLRVRMLLREE